MKTFWLQTLASIDWRFSGVEIIGICGLVFWLWFIWPTKALRLLYLEQAPTRRIFWVSLGITSLWLLNASVMQSMHGHFLGLVVVMMMFGWRLTSFIVLAPVLFFCTFVMKQPALFGLYAMIAVLLPIFVSYLFYIQSFKYLPKHLFVYIFIGGFFNAGLMICIHILGWALWLWSSGTYSWSSLVDNYLILIPLLGFPEALLNGMALTLLVVYRPQWLYDYSDRHYL